MGKIYLFLIVAIILASSAYAANINQLIDQHNSILNSFTIFNSNQFNTYLIPDSVPSGHDEIRQIWTRTKELRNYRIQKANEREQLEDDLEEKTKNWLIIIEDDVYYGFDEEIFGTKKFYLYWE